MSDQAEEITTEEEPPKGYVETIKETLANKESLAQDATPEGMEFLGWELDGWLASYPLMDSNARPVYAFPR